MKLPSWSPWAAIGVVLAAALVFFRSALGLSLLLVLLILLVVALIVAIVILIKSLKQAQAAEEIERTISTQADADIEKSTAGELAEMERLKTELLEAIDTLKKSRRGKGGDDVLVSLPWYMLIGPAGAGKSELVRRSGLHFPLQDERRGPKAVKGVGGTRGFSWWLAEEAVLLDLGGRTLATAAFDDTSDWKAFLDTLRKQRGMKPINGVVVVVAIDQLADQPETRIDSVARAARERIEEMIEHLGVVFPIYVLFNRVDQVAGFAEFFGDVPQAERQSAWGATLSLERARAVNADDLFDEEFGVLLSALSERRLPRMASMPDAPSRALAFAFPLQLQRIQGSLRRFLRTLFEGSSHVEAPPFRGFYLTAAAQQGDATDRVLAPAARTLGLSVHASTTTAAAGRATSWFARDLFSDVVFPDAGLAVRSKGAKGQVAKSQRVMWLGVAAAFALCVILFSSFSCANGALVGRVRKSAVEASERVRVDRPMGDNLRALESLRRATHAVDSVSARPSWWRRLGGWSADQVRDPGVDLWTLRATETVIAPAVGQMESDLRQMLDSQQGTFLEFYRKFRAYRLLTTPAQITEADADVIAGEVRTSLESQLALGTASPTDKREIPVLIDRQIGFLVRHPNALAKVVRRFYNVANADLVARGGQRVRDTWDSSQFYGALVAEAGSETKPVTLADMVGSTTLLTGGGEVPGPYTKKGWQSGVKPRIDALGKMVARDWLLHDVFRDRPPDVAGDVLKLYARDYSKRWADFLGSVTVADPPDMGASAEQLARLAKGDSPLFKVMRGVCDQTRLGAAPDSPLGATQHDFVLLCDFFETKGGSAIGKLSSLNPFKKAAGQGGDANDPNQARSAVYQSLLLAAQKEIVKAAQPGAPADNVRKLLAEGDDTTNPLRALVAFAQDFGAAYDLAAGAAPTIRLLQSPITGARGAVIQRGLGPKLTAAWTSIVLEPFNRTLAGRYPFAASGEDASLDDFTACFGPTGYFWDFYKGNLADFLNEDGSSKTPEATPVPASMVDFLKKAYSIRQAFFAAGPQPALSFTVRTTPPDKQGPDVNVRWVAFDCGGATATYSMGPPHDEPLTWPGADPTAGASLRAQAVVVQEKKKKGKEPPAVPVDPVSGSGIWGLFRLLDKAQSLDEHGNSASVKWKMRAGATTLTVSYEIQGSTVHHPFRRGGMRITPPAL